MISHNSENMKKAMLFISLILMTGLSIASDTETFRSASDSTQATGERRRNPATVRNPHPDGISTSERVKNPNATNQRSLTKREELITNDRSAKQPE